MFLISQYVVCIRSVKNGTIMPPLVPNSQDVIQCWFIHDMIIPNKCVSGADVLNDFVTSFLCQFGSFVYI